MTPRPPVVTILGHVDHGKTTLLDFIRKSRIADREHGGITQRIGAYEVKTAIKGYSVDRITFIDTPGHEAFSKLRAQGAEVADIALLIIDAKDSLKPQTIESISHIKAANIPFIVVLNKTDLPEANPEKVKIDLMKHDVIVEDKGGAVASLLISAKTGQGVPELLEAILLISSEKNLTFDPIASPRAYVIETKKDKRGIVASVVLKDGKIKVGDVLYAKDREVKVKAMINDIGTNLQEAEPSTPFELLGFNELPDVGSLISLKKVQIEIKEEEVKEKAVFDINSLMTKVKEKKLSLIIKTDSQGSLEAITNSLARSDKIELILAGVGAIYKSDVFLAKTTGAIVIGFNAKPDTDVADLAKQEKVIIKTYNIIYELLDELTEVADLMKEKEEKEKNLKGEAKILATFIIEREKIYGVKVTKGKINLSDNIELYRDSKLVSKTKLVSLKMRAKPIEEVKKDQEAGMLFHPELDMKVGDVIKSIL